jgi:hypothetical protein
MKNTDRAFPSLMTFENADGVQRLESGGSGMTLRQYAAIKLKVPRSGDPDIDAMIRESRRAEFAGLAMEAKIAGILASSSWDSREIRTEPITKEAFAVAVAMLARWEKEAGK